MRTALILAILATALLVAPSSPTSAHELVYDAHVTFLYASNIGDPDHAFVEGNGSVIINPFLLPSGSIEVNYSSVVRLSTDYPDLLEVFEDLNSTWSAVLEPGDLIVLNESGMNALLRRVIREAGLGLVLERTARLDDWGGRPALKLNVRIYNNESRPEYLMLYRVSINSTYWYDLSTGYLLESSLRYWIITSKGPMQVYMNGSADYRLKNVDELPGPGKVKTYWFRIGYDVGRVIITWEGKEDPKAGVEEGKIVIRGGNSRIMSVAVLSPYEPTIEFGGGEVAPATHPLSPPWGSFTLVTVGDEELRIGFEEGVDEVSESPPGEEFPWYMIAGAGAVAAVVGAVLVARKRRG